MKNQIEQDIENLKKEIVVDDVEALLLTAGGDYSPRGIECPYCNRDIDLDEIFKKVKNRAKLQQAEKDYKVMNEEILKVEKVWGEKYKFLLNKAEEISLWKKDFIEKLKEKGRTKKPDNTGKYCYILSEEEIDKLAGEIKNENNKKPKRI